MLPHQVSGRYDPIASMPLAVLADVDHALSDAKNDQEMQQRREKSELTLTADGTHASVEEPLKRLPDESESLAALPPTNPHSVAAQPADAMCGRCAVRTGSGDPVWLRVWWWGRRFRCSRPHPHPKGPRG